MSFRCRAVPRRSASAGCRARALVEAAGPVRATAPGQRRLRDDAAAYARPAVCPAAAPRLLRTADDSWPPAFALPPRVEEDERGGHGDIQRVHACAHRNRDPVVGALNRAVRQPRAFATEEDQ